MKRDNELIIHNIERDAIRVVMVADVHLGAIEHNAKKWADFIKWVQDNPDVYVCLGGDLVNNGIRSSVGNPFDEAMRPADQKRVMVDHLRPIKDRILCAVSGNHEYRSTRDADTDITYDIMSKLDLEDYYRPNVAYIVLRLGKRYKGSGKSKTSWNIVVTHGANNGMLAGSGINSQERFLGGLDGIDILFTGHTHRPSVVPAVRAAIDTRNGVITYHKQYMVSTASWMDYGGYAARKMLKPLPAGEPPVVSLGGLPDKKRVSVNI